jgi:4-hydroxy-2-oxoheptanedioate aldolase
MNMRPSRLLERLQSGATVCSIKVNLNDSRVVELAGIAGFDCVWTDQEHVANDLGQIERQILAAKAYQIDIIVRVPRGSYSSLVWPLELDAGGIMVPHIMSLADARQVVNQTRFHPLGRRPVDGGNADGGFCAVPFLDYLEQANRQRLLIVQIEDPEPLAELDEIAALPGLDMLFFGPGDFSQAIGHPGVWDHPELVRARRLVAEAAVRHGKFAGTVGSPALMEELTSLGYRFINLGADVVGLGHYFADLVQAFRKAEPAAGAAYYGARQD